MSDPQPSARSAGMPPDQETVGDASPSSPEGSRSGWGSRLLPLAPILLALGVALAVRQFRRPSTSKVEPGTLGAPAPDFSLSDSRKDAGNELVTLSRLVQKGPVVIIFHRGLQCPVCAQNLLTFVERMDDFRKAGIQVVALSPQAPEETRTSVETLGAFPFPLLWDSDSKVARAFGVETSDGTLLDGAFVIDMDGRIQMANVSNEPFGDIAQLLEVGTRSRSPH